jgi:TATA-box binding protein (TBP) (component of TFIID and TFIIIB)
MATTLLHANLPDIQCKLVSGFAYLSGWRCPSLREIYEAIEVDEERIVWKKLCAQGFRLELHRDPPRPGGGSVNTGHEKPTFLEVKLASGLVLGLYNSGTIKVAGAATDIANHEERLEASTKWFIDTLLRLDYESMTFRMHNIMAQFSLGFGLRCAEICRIFSSTFGIIRLPGREKAPHDAVRMRPRDQDKRTISLLYPTGVCQVMGCKTEAAVKEMVEMVVAAVQTCNFAFEKLEPKEKRRSKFAKAGIKKGRGRPSKAMLAQLETVQKNAV